MVSADPDPLVPDLGRTLCEAWHVAGGLDEEEAAERLRRIGPNVLARQWRTDLPALILAQLASPIVLILLGATSLDFFWGDAAGA